MEILARAVLVVAGLVHLLPVVGLRGAWGIPRWRVVPGTMLVLCLIVWGIPNTLAYTTGQFLEWNHGRFYYGGPDDPDNRAAPLAATALAKIGWGLAQGGLTALVGTVWCTFWGTVLIWLPARIRANRVAGAVGD